HQLGPPLYGIPSARSTTHPKKPALWAVSSSGLLDRAWRLLGDGIDDVGFDAINSGGSKPVEDLVLHLAGQLSAHLIDRPPQATPQRHGPEILERAQRLVTVFSSNVDTLSAAVMEERADRLRRRDAVPGVKGGIQIGAH